MSCNRFAACLLAALLALCAVAPSGAQNTPRLWFGGTWFVPERSEMHDGVLAIATGDPALARLLVHLGATLSYDPAQRYVLVAAADRRSVSFAIGDRRYSVDGAVQTAPFAPYVSGGEAYLPFLALAKALYVEPVSQGDVTVLQPQIAELDVRAQGRITLVDLHGASTLRFKRLSASSDGKLKLTFLGTASTLDAEREVAGEGLREILIGVGGTARNPTTTVTFRSVEGASHVLLPAGSANEILLAFAPPGVALRGTPVPATGTATVAEGEPGYAQPPPEPASQTTAQNSNGTPNGESAPAPPPNLEPGGASSQPLPEAGSAAPASVVNATVEPSDDALDVRLWFSGGPVAYEWHRLPDDRWYVDFKNATLVAPPQDQTLQNGAVLSLRLKQAALDPVPVVRLAFTLATPRIVNLVPFDGGITVSVSRLDDLSAQRAGTGAIGAGPAVAQAPPEDQPMDETPAPVVAPTPWKFSPPPVTYAARNPRLIVLDPGHGGSDTGAVQRGLVEKELTLDIAQRLRALLVSRGWLVEMTRVRDVDVFEPNDSAHDELQARCDIANHAGARMFISVHVNSFTSASLNGTTTYYFKSIDLPLARAIHARLIGSLGTADDGVRKENFYVIHHTTMPATLVETAFMSNANDATLLRSPAWRQKVAVAIADGVGDYAGPAPAPKDDAPDDASDVETPPDQ